MLNKISSFIIQFLKVTKEFIITLTISLFPIIIGAGIVKAFTGISFLSSFVEHFNSGEIFLYTSAFLGPYLINRNKDNFKDPFKNWCFYSFLGAILLGSYIFLCIRTTNITGIPLRLDNDEIFYCGFGVIILTIFTWYSSTWINYSSPKNTHEILKNQQNNLVDQFNNKFGG